jgi:hypothetical protein
MFANGGLGTHSSNTTPYGLTLPSGGPAQFFGLVSDTPIAAIFLASGFNSGQLALQDFEIGTGSGGGGGGDTPETSTIFMVSGGLAGLYFSHRRRRKADKGR